MQVKDWPQFQHFKDRRPPWIKLYRDLLDDPNYHALPNESAKYLPLIWLVASNDKTKSGLLPPPNELAFILRLTEAKTEAILESLSHYLVQGDISVISGGCQDDAPEGEGEGETKKEKIEKSVYLSFGEFGLVQLTQREYDALLTIHGLQRLTAGLNELDGYIKEKGKEKAYKSHYAALRQSSWVWDKVGKIPGQTPRKVSNAATFERVLNEIVLECGKRPEDERHDYLMSCKDKYRDIPKVGGKSVVTRAMEVLRAA